MDIVPLKPHRGQSIIHFAQEIQYNKLACFSYVSILHDMLCVSTQSQDKKFPSHVTASINQPQPPWRVRLPLTFACRSVLESDRKCRVGRSALPASLVRNGTGHRMSELAHRSRDRNICWSRANRERLAYKYNKRCVIKLCLCLL